MLDQFLEIYPMKTWFNADSYHFCWLLLLFSSSKNRKICTTRNIHGSEVGIMPRAAFYVSTPPGVFLSNLIASFYFTGKHSSCKNGVAVQSHQVSTVQPLEVHSRVQGFLHFHSCSNSWTHIPSSKIQGWLNQRDCLNRFSMQKVETCLSFKSKQVLSRYFSRGQPSSFWKDCTHHRKTWLGWGQSHPMMMAHDKIMSPLLYKQKRFDKNQCQQKVRLFLLYWAWNGIERWC